MRKFCVLSPVDGRWQGGEAYEVGSSSRPSLALAVSFTTGRMKGMGSQSRPMPRAQQNRVSPTPGPPSAPHEQWKGSSNLGVLVPGSSLSSGCPEVPRPISQGPLWALFLWEAFLDHPNPLERLVPVSHPYYHCHWRGTSCGVPICIMVCMCFLVSSMGLFLPEASAMSTPLSPPHSATGRTQSRLLLLLYGVTSCGRWGV